jgi:hypothetical protein
MYYSSWTPSYVAPSEPGITAGTLSVPTVKNTDWNLVKEDVGNVTYRTTSLNGTIALSTDVNIQNDVKTNPYGATSRSPKRPIPVTMQAAGLNMASVYVSLEDWGLALTGPEADDASAVVPLQMSLSIKIPVGVEITTAQIQQHAGILLSQLSTVDSNDTVVPFGKLSAMAGGGIRI